MEKVKQTLEKHHINITVSLAFVVVCWIIYGTFVLANDRSAVLSRVDKTEESVKELKAGQNSCESENRQREAENHQSDLKIIGMQSDLKYIKKAVDDLLERSKG